MKKYVFIIWFLAPIIGKGQFLSATHSMVLDTSETMKVGIMIDGYANSSALTARAVNGVFQGGYITRDERQQMLNRSGSFNNEGTRLYSSLYFTHRLDSLFRKPTAGLHYFIQAKHRIENYATFSSNALELALFGNKSLAGDTVGLTPLDYREQQFQQLQFGIAKNTNNLFSYYVGVSVLIGQKTRQLDTYVLDMYTAESGDTIQLNASADLYESNPINNSFLGNNGLGFSLDAGIQMPFYLFNDSQQVSLLEITVSDIGFISWYNTGQQTQVDTNFTYTGTHFTNIFDPGAIIFYQDPGLLIDSLTTEKNTTFTTYLPTTVTAKLSHTYKSWNYAILGAFRNASFYKPFFALQAKRLCSEKWTVGAQLNTGGYGTIGGGIYAEFTTGPITIIGGSHQMEGFIAPNKTAGQQLFIALNYAL